MSPWMEINNSLSDRSSVSLQQSLLITYAIYRVNCSLCLIPVSLRTANSFTNTDEYDALNIYFLNSIILFYS